MDYLFVFSSLFMLPWAGAGAQYSCPYPLKQIMSLESTGWKTAFSYSSHVFLVPKLSLVYGKTNIHICTLDVNNSCLGFQSNFPTFLPCCLTLTFQANSLFDRSLHHKFSGEGSDLASGWFSNVQVVVVACTTICTTDVFNTHFRKLLSNKAFLWHHFSWVL